MSQVVLQLLRDNVALAVLVAVLVAVGVRKLLHRLQVISRLPPGPPGVPFFGYIPFLPRDYGHKLVSLANHYGKVFCIRIGSMDVVFCSDVDVLRTCLSKDTFNFRTEFDFFSNFVSSSLLYWVGNESKDQRKLALRVFRSLGLGKQEMEDMINDEIDYLVHQLEKEDGKAIGVKRIIGSSVSNVVSKLVLGERYDFDHPNRILLDDSFLDLDDVRPSLLGAGNYVPLLSFFMRFTPNSRSKRFTHLYRKIVSFVLDRRDQLKKTFDPKTQTPSCFMEAYLKEMADQGTTEGEKDSSSRTEFLDDDHLYGASLEFFAAGSNAPRDFMLWFLLFMMLHPEEQQRMREEIMTVIGPDGQPSMRHKRLMPITEAILLETLRHSILLPIGVVHAVAQDEPMSKYLLPKGTHVVMNIGHIFRNPEYFPDPESFKPDRFLKDGVFVRDERVIGFGTGKRTCPGEPIAMVETFLYSVQLVRSFRIKAPTGHKYNTDGMIGSIQRIPKSDPLDVIFEKIK